MTDQEINIAIAHACEFEVRLSSLQSGLDIVKDGERYPLPNYTTDLNAMHEAEKVLSPLCRAEYAIALADITNRRGVELDYVGATARQRAEAFLRTLGKWPVTKQAAFDKSSQ